MRILIAPQEFKGSLSAEEAAAAIAEGIASARPGWTLDLLPMSDGGPGFIDAMRRALRTDIVAIAVHGPLRRPTVARYLAVRGTNEIIIEAAQANGLLHLMPDERDALRADTFGVGELIAAAARHAPSRVIVGVGGSATTDGGSGMAEALGARFLDADGNPLPPGGAALARLEHIEWTPPTWAGTVPVVVATDVTNPLLGPNGAAAVYGPQKGASAADVITLEAGLQRFAEVVEAALGVDIRSTPGGGAAGGLAAGLIAFLGASVASGFEVVANATNLAARVQEADLVITGEGRFDSQSVQGKTTGRLLDLAAAAGKPVVVFAGQATAPGQDVLKLSAIEPDSQRAMSRAHELLAQVAHTWARDTRTRLDLA